MEKPTEETSFDGLDALHHVPFDNALDALAYAQRRKLLFALLEHNPQDDAPAILIGNDATEAERLIMMQHSHLPKLEEYGFINWDRETQEVHKGPGFDEIKPLLKLLDDHEDDLPTGWM